MCGKGRKRALQWTLHRWSAFSLLFKAFPVRVSVLIGLVIVKGALPAAFAALVAVLVSALADLDKGGVDSERLVVVLAAIAATLVGQELTNAAFQVIRWDLYRRYEEYLVARVLKATLSTPRLDLFEDPVLAKTTDQAVKIAAWEPGDLVDGLTWKWAFRAEGAAAALLVAYVAMPAVIPLATLWLLFGQRLGADLRRADEAVLSEARQTADYYAQVGMRSEWAKEIRVFGLADWVSARFHRHWQRVVDEMRRARLVDQRAITLFLVAIVVANGAVVAWAIGSAMSGSLGAGELTALLQGLAGMVLLADQAGDDLIKYGSSHIPVVRKLEEAARAPVRPAGTRSAEVAPSREIRFENVRFAYPGRESPVFSGLNLRIEAGTSLGVVGLNGAGKTTLIKLLSGLEVPQHGRIVVDGVDLAEYDLDSWRRSIAAIFQDFVRYELPARDNLGFGAIEHLGKPDLDAELLRVAERAGAAKLLADLPSGLDTPLSRRFQGGVDLSGGQWQRIALARAIRAVDSGARLLVLDEPTAQLDVRAEADIYDRFLELTKELTTIVISHRFSTVRRASRIVVLECGRISEDGTHDQLVAADGEYARLFRTQATRYVEDVR